MGTVRHGWFVASATLLVLSGCASPVQRPDTAATPSIAPTAASSAPVVRDVMTLEDFEPLEVGTYSIDPDQDPSTPLRVLYDIPDEGWSSWIGAAKFVGDSHVGVSITTVSNLVKHGCEDHAWADPPVGPSVDDLAAALAELAPFVVASPPRDVSVDGYTGTHLELTVPELPVGGDGSFTGCVDGALKSWVAAIDVTPGDAFYGYTGPGYVDEFWILDVDGTRLVVAAERSAGSPPGDVEELRRILESIRIEV